MYQEKIISPQAKEDFLKSLEIPIKNNKFSIHSIVNNKAIRINDLPLKPYKTILESESTDTLISLVNTLTNGLLYNKISLRNKPKKYHNLIR